MLSKVGLRGVQHLQSETCSAHRSCAAVLRKFIHTNKSTDAARASFWPARSLVTRRHFSAEEEDDPIAEGVVVVEKPSTTALPSRSISKDLNDLPINFADISRAEVAIRGGVKRTTCEKSHFISELVGANVFLKTEFRQFTGSFKERGARNAILQVMREQKSNLRGVIAASAGNHALALAYHGKELGVPVTVVMPTVAPLAKVDKCRVRFCTLFVLLGLRGSRVLTVFLPVIRRNLELASLSTGLTLVNQKSLLRLWSKKRVCITSMGTTIHPFWPVPEQLESKSWKTCPMWMPSWCPLEGPV